MKVDDLKEGKLYSNQDRNKALFYVGTFGYLYDFVSAEYDDLIQDFAPTNDERRLTASEVKNLIEW